MVRICLSILEAKSEAISSSSYVDLERGQEVSM